MANGGVHVLEPGPLLFFPTPSDDVPDGQDWVDSVSADGRGSRRFTDGYYASLLFDLDVSAAALLGRSSAASARVFVSHRVAALHLRLLAPARGAAGFCPACAGPALSPCTGRRVACVVGGDAGGGVSYQPVHGGLPVLSPSPLQGPKDSWMWKGKSLGGI